MDPQNYKEHYICLGGCEGVSSTPGVCQTDSCESYGESLTSCGCTDGAHHDFELADMDDLGEDTLD